MNSKKKKANVINENETTKNCYDNEMFRPTIDVEVKTNKKINSSPKKD